METRGIRTYMPAFFALALLVSAACQKEDSRADSTVARTELDIRLSVDGGASVSEEQTKSVVTGTTLNESGRTYGIIACEHEDVPSEYRPYDYDAAGIYGNIQAWYGDYSSMGTEWWYSYEASANSRFRPLYLVTDDTSRHLDIYAYSPWKAGTTITDGYQYDLTSVAETDLPDLMYATYEDGEGNPTNKDIVIGNDPSVPVNIKFHHALSRICFHFKLATAQNTGLDGQHTIRLWQISLLRKPGAETTLYTKGTMDLITGEVTSTQAPLPEKLSVTYATTSDKNQQKQYDIYQDNVWKTCDMLVHPIELLQDGDFSFRFYFEDIYPQNTLAFDYEINRSDLLHSDGAYGFQPGYCYHFYFIIDNYIHLQNVVINTDWTLADETEIKI